jgi:hypothetical protein
MAAGLLLFGRFSGGAGLVAAFAYPAHYGGDCHHGGAG